MTKVSRFSLMLLIALALVASVGCTKPVTQPDTPPAATDAAARSLSEILEDAGIAIETASIYFAYDRYDLDDAAKALLRAKADLLKQYPAISVKVEGHCDARGTEEYNLALGERRARAAYDYLVMLGVDPAQLSMVSYGKLYPALEGNSEEAWSKNRRAEFRPTIVYPQ